MVMERGKNLIFWSLQNDTSTIFSLFEPPPPLQLSPRALRTTAVVPIIHEATSRNQITCKVSVVSAVDFFILASGVHLYRTFYSYEDDWDSFSQLIFDSFDPNIVLDSVMRTIPTGSTLPTKLSLENFGARRLRLLSIYPTLKVLYVSRRTASWPTRIAPLGNRSFRREANNIFWGCSAIVNCWRIVDGITNTAVTTVTTITQALESCRSCIANRIVYKQNKNKNISYIE